MTIPTLEAAIIDLKARQDIHDLLVRYCRGADLCDAAIMKFCFHDDAIDDHGFFVGSAHEFADRAAVNLATLFTATRHILTNEYVELAGLVAKSEACVLLQSRFTRDGDTFDVTGCCRYLDRLESRDGVWKIAHRQLVSDGSRVEKVVESFALIDRGAPGARGSDDPSAAFFARDAEFSQG